MPLSEKQWLASLKAQLTAGEAIELRRLEDRLIRLAESDAHPRLFERVNSRIDELLGLDKAS